MKLGTLLLRNAAIGLSQLEAALRNQVLYGGRLGTNLVELGFLDLELLSTYLAELTGLPVATRTGGFTIHAPLIELTKAQIIALGISLGVDYASTHSCYDPVGTAACGRCDACVLRRKGFHEAGVPDPTRYAPAHAPGTPG